MDTDVLKVFAATYVKESDNIELQDKLFLVKFIKEAEKDSVLSLLSTGIPSHVVTESEIPLEYVEQWVEGLVEYDLDEVNQISLKDLRRSQAQHVVDVARSAAAKRDALSTGAKVAVGAAAVAAAGVLAYKRFFSKAAKACKGKPDRSACVAKYKAGAQKAKAAAIAAKKGKK